MSQVHLTSSAENGLPSCHLTPSRNGKSQFGPVLVPRPAGGQIGHYRLHAVLLHVLVKNDEIVEDPHHRPIGQYRRFFVDRHARRAVEDGNSQNATRLLGEGRSVGRDRHQQRTRRCGGTQIVRHLPCLPSFLDRAPALAGRFYLSSQTSLKRQPL